ATVVIGGLISATLLTLFVLPTLYARFGGWRESESMISGDRLDRDMLVKRKPRRPIMYFAD
ncbi:MAG: hypothetical protein ABW128_17315, partial [Rhizorhabdus sp.]